MQRDFGSKFLGQVKALAGKAASALVKETATTVSAAKIKASAQPKISSITARNRAEATYEASRSGDKTAAPVADAASEEFVTGTIEKLHDELKEGP